jgi:AcrR family transcriptional regulator
MRSNGAPKRIRLRLEILRSAAERFRDRGFDATSMEDIARGVSMTKGNLYYYFKNKREILYFAQEASLRRLLELADRIGRRRGLEADQKLQLLIEAHLRCLLQEMHASAAHIEFHALPPSMLRRVIAKRDRYERRVRRIVEEGMRRGRFAAGDAKLATFTILGALNWTVRWYRPRGGWGIDSIAKGMSAHLVRGLLASGREMREAPLGSVMDV